jgi:nickel-dependent lactate racemase
MVFGDIDDSLTTLNASVKELYSTPITKRADIVVIGVGGSPFDESLLGAIDAFPAGLNALKKDGTLILAAECGKGHGDTEFYEWSSEHKEPRYLETRLRHKFNYNGFKASFLSRTQESHRVCLVSTIPDYYVENVFRMKSATTVNAALHNAQRAQGSDSTITVIPNAGRVIPVQIEAAKG